MPTRALPWAGVVCGIAVFAVGVLVDQEGWRLIRDGDWVNGRVTKVEVYETGVRPERTFQYHAIVVYRVREFDLALERSWQVKEGGRCYWPCFAAGEEVKVRYLPDEPARARVDSFVELYFEPAIYAALGACFVVAGFVARRLR